MPYYKQATINGQRFYLVPVDTVLGRPKKIDTKNKALLETLLLQKTYMKREEMAEFYGVSESTMARALREARRYAKEEETE